MPKKKPEPLTEQEWRDVFKAKCKSKQGQLLSPEERDVVDRAFKENQKRYSAMEHDVFEATMPFGANPRRRKKDNG